MWRASCVVVVWATLVGAQAKKEPEVIQQVVFEVHRAAQPPKYPLPVKERYALQANGTLAYFAYFEGMPIELNHVDSVEWASGPTGTKALEAVRSAIGKARPWADGDTPPQGAYVVTVRTHDSDFTVVLSRGQRALDGAFEAMLAAFEKQLGRPLKPGDLPQAGR